MGIIYNVIAQLGVWRGGNRRTGNYGISINSSSHEKVKLALEGIYGYNSDNFASRVKKDDCLRRR